MPKQIHAQKDADLTRSSHPSLMPHTPASTSRYMTSKQQTAAGQEGFCVVPMRPFRLEVWKRLSVVLCAIVKTSIRVLSARHLLLLSCHGISP